LEEDIAMTNISLDLIGQAMSLLDYAGELEGQGKDHDALAFYALKTNTEMHFYWSNRMVILPIP
jgi:1,2-phenylacetyl-CoA epoxidase catalytic subunit